MTKLALRLLIMLLAVGVVLGGVFFFDSFRSKMIARYVKSFANPTQTVATMIAQPTPWQATITAVGSLRAVNGADLSADIEGIVDELHFRSGEDVAAGTVLLRLRGEDDAAKLRQLQAQAALARTNYQRDLSQVRAQAVARATVDSDRSALQSAEAAVAQQQATMAKKTVTAPFAGHLGLRKVDIGQYVAAGAAIVSLQALDPIYVDFNVPQQNLSDLRIGQSVSVTVDGYPGRQFVGAIEALNSALDPATRTLQVRASLPNTDHALLPGMFATVAVAIGAPQALITLPQTAVSYNPYGSTVFVIAQAKPGAGSGLIVQQVFVQTGQTRGDQIAITAGIKAGQQIVIAGQLKLRNGTPVAVNNSVLPSNDPDPVPVDR